MKPNRTMRFPAPDTLVAIMPNLGDFAIAQQQHWYRIPCRTAPAMLATARWLAFYHPAAFGTYKWAIHFFTRIERIDQVLRKDLLPGEPAHPHANDRYFRISIGALEQLDQPVLSARRRRIAFIPTTLAKLRSAVEINDLYHESPLEDQLWRALVEAKIPAERQYYVAEKRAKYCLDFAVLCARSGIDIECDGDTWHLRPDAVAEDNRRNNALTQLGWSVLRFSSRELIDSEIHAAIDLVRETSQRLGGIEMPNAVNRRYRHSGGIVEQYRLW